MTSIHSAESSHIAPTADASKTVARTSTAQAERSAARSASVSRGNGWMPANRLRMQALLHQRTRGQSRHRTAGHRRHEMPGSTADRLSQTLPRCRLATSTAAPKTAIAPAGIVSMTSAVRECARSSAFGIQTAPVNTSARPGSAVAMTRGLRAATGALAPLSYAQAIPQPASASVRALASTRQTARQASHARRRVESSFA